MRYQIEYADGVKVEIPVRFGEGIEQWYRVQTVAPMLWARDSWTKVLDATSGENAVFYSMSVPNPRPDQPIKVLRALPSTDPEKQYGTALILCAALDNSPLQGNLYVVERKPMGSDAQPGSFEQPFGTLQHALDIMKPGDTVLVRGGFYALDARVVKKFDGQTNQWLTVSAFPGETPVFDASGVHLDYRDKKTENLGSGEQDCGAIHIWGDPDFFRLQGLHVQNSRFAAISVYGQQVADQGTAGKWGDSDHIEILFNDTLQSFSMGIISHRTNHLKIIGNRVFRPHSLQQVFDARTGEQIQRAELPQEAIDISRNQNFEVAFNTITGGTKEAIDCISIEDGSVHHNYIDSCLNGIYIDSWSVPIQRVEIYNNFIINAYSGVPLATEGGSDLFDIDIHNNSVFDSKMGGIEVTEATYKASAAKVQHIRVRNNTIDRSGDHALSIGWQANGIRVAGFRDNPNFSDVKVWNNLVTDAAGRSLKNAYSLTAKEHDIEFTHNLVWPINEDTTPEWLRTEKKGWVETDLEKGISTLVADPLYVNPARGDYRLSKNSPAIGAGKKSEDLGALPYGTAWMPGLDFAGTVTSLYRGETDWKPLSIPRDLYTVYRNNLQRPSWFQRGRYGPDFRNLPAGDQSLACITFDIEEDGQPSVLVPVGFSTESTAKTIRIPVGKKAARLAFLHNAHIANRQALKANPQIFHYLVSYSDGSTVEIPIRTGQEIEEWMNNQKNPLQNGRIAWSQPLYDKRGKRQPDLRLYAFEWNNPKPDLEIASIEIVKDCDYMTATPAVFAISAGN